MAVHFPPRLFMQLTGFAIIEVLFLKHRASTTHMTAFGGIPTPPGGVGINEKLGGFQEPVDMGRVNSARTLENYQLPKAWNWHGDD